MTAYTTKSDAISPPRVAVVISGFFPPDAVGGAELVAYEQALGLRDSGFQVHVLAGGHGQRTPALEVSEDGLNIHWLGRSSLDPFGSLYNPYFLSYSDSLLRYLSPAISIVHNLAGLDIRVMGLLKRHSRHTVALLHDYWSICTSNILIDSAGHACDVARNCTCRVDGRLRESSPLAGLLRSNAILRQIRRADRVISPSQHLADEFNSRQAFFAVEHRSNGLVGTPATRAGGTHEGMHVGYSGYLGPHKGVQFLADAIELFCTQHPGNDVTFHFMGDGASIKTLRELETLLPLGKIAIHGLVPYAQMLESFQLLDVLVVPSIWAENEPVSILQGQAAGLAIIASDAGGIPDLVPPSSGILVRPRDHYALAEALNRYFGDGALLEAHQQGALAVARRRRGARHVMDLCDVAASGPSSGDSSPETISGLSGPVMIDGTFSGWFPADVWDDALTFVDGNSFLHVNDATLADWSAATGLLLTDGIPDWHSIRRATAQSLPVAIAGAIHPGSISLSGRYLRQLETFGELREWLAQISTTARATHPWVRNYFAATMPPSAYSLNEDGAF